MDHSPDADQQATEAVLPVTNTGNSVQGPACTLVHACSELAVRLTLEAHLDTGDAVQGQQLMHDREDSSDERLHALNIWMPCHESSSQVSEPSLVWGLCHGQHDHMALSQFKKMML